MKPLISAVLLAFWVLGPMAEAAELPFDQSQFEHARDEGKPLAVVFHAWWCPTCRAQAPVIKELSQQPEFASVTVFVADYDHEKALKRSLGVTKQSTVIVFKNGKESARSTGDTQQAPLAALLRHATS